MGGRHHRFAGGSNLRVAEGYGNAAPHAISWVGGGPCMQVRGGYSSMACHALNGLVGAVDNVGGTLVGNKEYTGKFPKPDDFMDAIAKKGKNHEKIDQRGRLHLPAIKSGKPGSAVVTNNAADGILNEDPYDIKVAIGYMNNFSFSAPQPERWERALSKIPFLVHITTNASEFSWFSDIVLPDTHHMFEKWGYVKSIGNGYRHVTLMQPIVKKVWDYKIDETEIPWLIAEKLAERGFDNLLRHYKTYKDPETGKEPADEKEFALYALKFVTQNLWDPSQYKGGDKFRRMGGIFQNRRVEFRPLPLPKAMGRHEDQDRDVRVLQRNPQGGPGSARRQPRRHGGRSHESHQLPGPGRNGVHSPL